MNVLVTFVVDPSTVVSVSYAVRTPAFASTLAPAPALALCSMLPVGTYSFDPSNTAYDYLKAGQTLAITAPFIISDGHGSLEKNLSIDIVGTNDAVVANGGNIYFDEDTTLSGTLRTLDTDPESDATYTTATSIAGFTLNSDGTFSISNNYQYLKANEYVDLLFDYTLTDPTSGETSSSSAAISIAGINDIPNAQDVAIGNIIEDGTIVLGTLTATDADTGDIMAYSMNDNIAGFTLDVQTGNYTFDPSDTAYDYLADSESLAISIAYTVTDQASTSDTATITITLLGVDG